MAAALKLRQGGLICAERFEIREPPCSLIKARRWLKRSEIGKYAWCLLVAGVCLLKLRGDMNDFRTANYSTPSEMIMNKFLYFCK